MQVAANAQSKRAKPKSKLKPQNLTPSQSPPRRAQSAHICGSHASCFCLFAAVSAPVASWPLTSGLSELNGKLPVPSQT